MSERQLPTKRNPLLEAPLDADDRQELVAKRKLGSTSLSVDAGQVGTSNATKPKNLGVFDYAHLRVPLPKDLKGSGIFHSSRGHPIPDVYFLMRRSSDGFVSASGMFKSAFPWATEEQELAEKAHLKTIPGAGKEEVAGNIWIPPQQALDLADEYKMREWVLILLDPATISSDSAKGTKQPPTFHPAPVQTSPARSTRAKTPTISNGISLPPPESPQDKSPRKRALRSASPSKIPAPDKVRKIATPKRMKRGRGASASVEPEDAAPPPTASKRKASKSLKPTIEEDETIKVDITSSIEVIPPGDEEIETTKVIVETPADHATLSLPDDAQAYLDSARQTISQAKALKENHAASVRGRKRKAVDITEEEDDDELPGQALSRAEAERDPELPALKRQRLNDIEVRAQKVKTRAAVGIAAGLAIGAFAPFLGSLLGY